MVEFTLGNVPDFSKIVCCPRQLLSLQPKLPKGDPLRGIFKHFRALLSGTAVSEPRYCQREEGGQHSYGTA